MRLSSNIIFPGYVFGDGYRELVHRCGVMCVPTEVGGTHPVIVEAMAAKASIVVSDHKPNLEVVGQAAAMFSLAGGSTSLATSLQSLIDDADHRKALGVAAAKRAAQRFSWSRCAERYLALATELVGSKRSNETGRGVTRANRSRVPRE